MAFASSMQDVRHFLVQQDQA